MSATLCGPSARSAAFPIIAISDEHPKELETFFRKHPEPFPGPVGADLRRIQFQTPHPVPEVGRQRHPTIVLVGEDDVVRDTQIGYGVRQGLRFDGWSWNGGGASAP